MNTELSTRIKEALTGSGKTQAQIARELGKTPGAVSHWITGETKSLKAETAAALERVTGYSATWIATGRGSKMAGEPANIAPAEIGARLIPLLDYVQAGAWTSTQNIDLSEVSEWLTSDIEARGEVFALEIRGESMTPEFAEGDRVVIDTGIRAQPGDYVVAQQAGGKATFKKYRLRGIDQNTGVEKFDLIPLNEDYPTLSADERTARIVGVMVEHRRYRRRR